MARCDTGEGPGILFNGWRILGVHAQDGKLTGDHGRKIWPVARARGRRRRETGLTGWPGLSAAQARAAGGAERPCGLGRCEAGRGAGVAWAVKAGPGTEEGFGPCAG